MSAVLSGLVVAIAGAGGAAGAATAERLAVAGATVALADHHTERLTEVAERITAGGGQAGIAAVDLLDTADTGRWAADLLAAHGRVDGLVHLVGGWRGGTALPEADPADWTWLQERLVLTLVHTTQAFHAALTASPQGRLAVVSATVVEHPTDKSAAYAAAKAAAEAWTLAVADSFTDTPAAATILVVKALVTDRMRRERPSATFPGYTDVADLASAIVGLWSRPAAEVNGVRMRLVP